jgi:dolichyl-phosphate-mannose-protein mannosyltransferase
MGRVTYIHHYLPTLYFAVLMAGHLSDHFIFKSRRLKSNTKYAIFALLAGVVIGTFWWFRGVAFGIDGPIKQHWGLLWRKVRSHLDRTFGFIADYVVQSWNIYESS